QVILVQGLTLPDKMAMKTNQAAEERISNAANFIIGTTGSFRGAGIMDVAEDRERTRTIHGGSLAGRGRKDQLGLLRSQASRRAGRRMEKVAPLFGWLSTRMEPRCSWMMRWVMGKPRPVPLDLVVKNGSNSRPMFSGLMPAPESWMVTHKWPGLREPARAGRAMGSATTETAPLGWVASRAF